MDATLRALAEPRRRRILELVANRELSAGEIASHFDIARPSVSEHLRVLRGAGLLAERRHGTYRFYTARREGLDELRRYLESFWAVQFGHLDEYLATTDSSQP